MIYLLNNLSLLNFCAFNRRKNLEKTKKLYAVYFVSMHMNGNSSSNIKHLYMCNSDYLNINCANL